MTHRRGELDGPRWLVLLLDGVRREELTAHAAPNLAVLLDAGHDAALEPELRAPERFFDALPLDALRDGGLELDRRSFSVREPWRSDRAVVDAIARRPRGRADALVLWLRDAGRAARRCGVGSAGHWQAIVDLDADVRRAVQLLRRDGADPRVITLTFAPHERVTRTFDLAAAMRRALRERTWRRLRVDVEPSHARIRCASMFDVAICADALALAPFTNHGALAPDASRLPNELVFVPENGVALGAEPVWAAPRLHGRGATASLPWETGASVTIADVARGFAERVREALRPVPLPEPATTMPADLPDLLALLDAETRQALGLETPAE